MQLVRSLLDIVVNKSVNKRGGERTPGQYTVQNTIYQFMYCQKANEVSETNPNISEMQH